MHQFLVSHTSLKQLGVSASTLRVLLLGVPLCGVLMVCASGCSRFGPVRRKSYTTAPKEPQKKADRAKQLNVEGLNALGESNLDEAEKLFSDALAADVNYGPAHNNLGQVYLQRKQLYLAAWEFEFAAKLMPDRSEARGNLGLVFETAGQPDEARTHYETAYDIEPDAPSAIGNLARILVKLDANPGRIRFLLQQLILHDTRTQWVAWAQDLLGTRYFTADLPLDVEQTGELPYQTDIPFSPTRIEELPSPTGPQPTPSDIMLPAPPDVTGATVLESPPLQFGYLRRLPTSVTPGVAPQTPASTSSLLPASFQTPIQK